MSSLYYHVLCEVLLCEVLCYVKYIGMCVCVCVCYYVKVIEAYTSLRVYFWLYELAIFILLIPYVSIRHLKKLAPFSMLANVLTVIGLAVTLFYCFTDLPSVHDRPAVASLTTLPLYFGIAIFTFEVCHSRFDMFLLSVHSSIGQNIKSLDVSNVRCLWTRLWRDLWTELHQICNIPVSFSIPCTNKDFLSRSIESSKRACVTINRSPFAKFGNF